MHLLQPHLLLLTFAWLLLLAILLFLRLQPIACFFTHSVVLLKLLGRSSISYSNTCLRFFANAAAAAEVSSSAFSPGRRGRSLSGYFESETTGGADGAATSPVLFFAAAGVAFATFAPVVLLSAAAAVVAVAKGKPFFLSICAPAVAFSRSFLAVVTAVATLWRSAASAVLLLQLFFLHAVVAAAAALLLLLGTRMRGTTGQRQLPRCTGRLLAAAIGAVLAGGASAVLAATVAVPAQTAAITAAAALANCMSLYPPLPLQASKLQVFSSALPSYTKIQRLPRALPRSSTSSSQRCPVLVAVKPRTIHCICNSRSNSSTARSAVLLPLASDFAEYFGAKSRSAAAVSTKTAAGTAAAPYLRNKAISCHKHISCTPLLCAPVTLTPSAVPAAPAAVNSSSFTVRPFVQRRFLRRCCAVPAATASVVAPAHSKDYSCSEKRAFKRLLSKKTTVAAADALPNVLHTRQHKGVDHWGTAKLYFPNSVTARCPAITASLLPIWLPLFPPRSLSPSPLSSALASVTCVPCTTKLSLSPFASVDSHHKAAKQIRRSFFYPPSRLPLTVPVPSLVAHTKSSPQPTHSSQQLSTPPPPTSPTLPVPLSIPLRLLPIVKNDSQQALPLHRVSTSPPPLSPSHFPNQHSPPQTHPPLLPPPSSQSQTPSTTPPLERKIVNLPIPIPGETDACRVPAASASSLSVGILSREWPIYGRMHSSRLSSSGCLVVGLDGLGVEAAKSLLLAGVGKLLLLDPVPCSAAPSHKVSDISWQQQRHLMRDNWAESDEYITQAIAAAERIETERQLSGLNWLQQRQQQVHVSERDCTEHTTDRKRVFIDKNREAASYIGHAKTRIVSRASLACAALQRLKLSHHHILQCVDLGSAAVSEHHPQEAPSRQQNASPGPFLHQSTAPAVEQQWQNLLQHVDVVLMCNQPLQMVLFVNNICRRLHHQRSRTRKQNRSTPGAYTNSEAATSVGASKAATPTQEVSLSSAVAVAAPAAAQASCTDAAVAADRAARRRNPKVRCEEINRRPLFIAVWTCGFAGRLFVDFGDTYAFSPPDDEHIGKTFAAGDAAAAAAALEAVVVADAAVPAAQTARKPTFSERGATTSTEAAEAAVALRRARTGEDNSETKSFEQQHTRILLKQNQETSSSACERVGILDFQSLETCLSPLLNKEQLLSLTSKSVLAGAGTADQGGSAADMLSKTDEFKADRTSKNESSSRAQLGKAQKRCSSLPAAAPAPGSLKESSRSSSRNSFSAQQPVIAEHISEEELLLHCAFIARDLWQQQQRQKGQLRSTSAGEVRVEEWMFQCAAKLFEKVMLQRLYNNSSKAADPILPIKITSEKAREGDDSRMQQQPLTGKDQFAAEDPRQAQLGQTTEQWLQRHKVLPKQKQQIQQRLQQLRQMVEWLTHGSEIRLAPIASLMGALAAQEALKAISERFTPFHQFFYFHAFDLCEHLLAKIPSQHEEQQQEANAQEEAVAQRPQTERRTPTRKKIGAHYFPFLENNATASATSPAASATTSAASGGVIVAPGSIRADFLRRLQALKVFVVGAGAVGCEMIKLLALGGVAASSVSSAASSTSLSVPPCRLSPPSANPETGWKLPHEQKAAKASLNVTLDQSSKRPQQQLGRTGPPALFVNMDNAPLPSLSVSSLLFSNTPSHSKKDASKMGHCFIEEKTQFLPQPNEQQQQTLGKPCGKKAEEGCVTVADADVVEKSNLNRQLLFTEGDLHTSKAFAAASAAKRIQPCMRLCAVRAFVGQESEALFNWDFWKQQHVVVMAVDTVAARMYLDSQCLLYQKPIVEAGTLGLRGHAQALIPHLTESYGSTADIGGNEEDAPLPVCSIKAYPTSAVHLTHWARALFNRFFSQNVNEVMSETLENEVDAQTAGTGGGVASATEKKLACAAVAAAAGRARTLSGNAAAAAADDTAIATAVNKAVATNTAGPSVNDKERAAVNYDFAASATDSARANAQDSFAATVAAGVYDSTASVLADSIADTADGGFAITTSKPILHALPNPLFSQQKQQLMQQHRRGSSIRRTGTAAVVFGGRGAVISTAIGKWLPLFMRYKYLKNMCIWKLQSLWRTQQSTIAATAAPQKAFEAEAHERLPLLLQQKLQQQNVLLHRLLLLQPQQQQWLHHQLNGHGMRRRKEQPFFIAKDEPTPSAPSNGAEADDTEHIGKLPTSAAGDENPVNSVDDVCLLRVALQKANTYAQKNDLQPQQQHGLLKKQKNQLEFVIDQDRQPQNQKLHLKNDSIAEVTDGKKSATKSEYLQESAADVFDYAALQLSEAEQFLYIFSIERALALFHEAFVADIDDLRQRAATEEKTDHENQQQQKPQKLQIDQHQQKQQKQQAPGERETLQRSQPLSVDDAINSAEKSSFANEKTEKSTLSNKERTKAALPVPLTLKFEDEDALKFVLRAAQLFCCIFHSRIVAGANFSLPLQHHEESFSFMTAAWESALHKNELLWNEDFFRYMLQQIMSYRGSRSLAAAAASAYQKPYFSVAFRASTNFLFSLQGAPAAAKAADAANIERRRLERNKAALEVAPRKSERETLKRYSAILSLLKSKNSSTKAERIGKDAFGAAGSGADLHAEASEEEAVSNAEHNDQVLETAATSETATAVIGAAARSAVAAFPAATTARAAVEWRVIPVSYNKDSLLHLEFLTAAARLRGRCFHFAALPDILSVQQLSARIVPATATATTVAAALACLNLYRLVAHNMLSNPQNLGELRQRQPHENEQQQQQKQQELKQKQQQKQQEEGGAKPPKRQLYSESGKSRYSFVKQKEFGDSVDDEQSKSTNSFERSPLEENQISEFPPSHAYSLAQHEQQSNPLRQRRKRAVFLQLERHLPENATRRWGVRTLETTARGWKMRFPIFPAERDKLRESFPSFFFNLSAPFLTKAAPLPPPTAVIPGGSMKGLHFTPWDFLRLQYALEDTSTAERTASANTAASAQEAGKVDARTGATTGRTEHAETAPNATVGRGTHTEKPEGASVAVTVATAAGQKRADNFATDESFNLDRAASAATAARGNKRDEKAADTVATGAGPFSSASDKKHISMIAPAVETSGKFEAANRASHPHSPAVKLSNATETHSVATAYRAKMPGMAATGNNECLVELLFPRVNLSVLLQLREVATATDKSETMQPYKSRKTLRRTDVSNGQKIECLFEKKHQELISRTKQASDCSESAKNERSCRNNIGSRDFSQTTQQPDSTQQQQHQREEEEENSADAAATYITVKDLVSLLEESLGVHVSLLTCEDVVLYNGEGDVEEHGLQEEDGLLQLQEKAAVEATATAKPRQTAAAAVAVATPEREALSRAQRGKEDEHSGSVEAEKKQRSREGANSSVASVVKEIVQNAGFRRQPLSDVHIFELNGELNRPVVDSSTKKNLEKSLSSTRVNEIYRKSCLHSEDSSNNGIASPALCGKKSEVDPPLASIAGYRRPVEKQEGKNLRARTPGSIGEETVPAEGADFGTKDTQKTFKWVVVDIAAIDDEGYEVIVPQLKLCVEDTGPRNHAAS